MADSSTPGLESAQEALSQGAWEQARQKFHELAERAESPEAWEGLAIANWWLEDATQTLRARQQAFNLYRRRGNNLSAARAAAFLANDFLDFRGDWAVAAGWIERGRTLREGQAESVEHGWLYAFEGYLAMYAYKDYERALQRSRDAIRIARSTGVLQLEILAQSFEGSALVSCGQVDAGMRRLDEAAAAATGGELKDFMAIGATCCQLIDACHRVGDYRRAVQWGNRMLSYCMEWDLGLFFASCRNHYCALLLWRGDWEQAAAELVKLRKENTDRNPTTATVATCRLGELRRRQGRTREARDLFRQAGGHLLATAGRAELAYDEGDYQTAVDLAELLSRRLSSDTSLQHIPVLELTVRSQSALGQLDAAGEALKRLDALAEVAGTTPIRAMALRARGVFELASDNTAQARWAFEDAADLFESDCLPFEAGTTRMALARVLYDLDRIRPAIEQACLARDHFDKLGAPHLSQNVKILLSDLDARDTDEIHPSRGQALTERQTEVLRLVANGMSDREIASILCLSEHTVHRHVANIFDKMGVSSRAAAVARALNDNVL